MPCVSLKHIRDYKASLKQAKELAKAQALEQEISEKANEEAIAEKEAATAKTAPAGAEATTTETTPTEAETMVTGTTEAAVAEPKISRRAKVKKLVERQKAKLASQKITRRAARSERKATRSSQAAAKKAEKAAQKTARMSAKLTQKAAKTAKKTASTAAIAGAAMATSGAAINAAAGVAGVTAEKITEQSLKIPHQRAVHATKVANGAATKAAKTVKKPAKLTPKTDIPGTISTASLKKSANATRPMPSSVFKRHQTKPTRADLINAESRLGSRLFGAIPEGHRREFFHDQKNIWIWHEDWTDETEREHEMTIRYEVRTSGVYKKVAAGKYFKLEGDELENFRKATHAYLYVIKKYLYNHPYSKAVA